MKDESLIRKCDKIAMSNLLSSKRTSAKLYLQIKLILPFLFGIFIGAIFTIQNCQIPSNTPEYQKPTQNERQNCFLAVLILTAPANTQQRDTIRQTWLRGSTRLGVLPWFVIGTAGAMEREEVNSLTSEQKRFGDLLLLSDVVDSYKNLTTKLLSSMVWLHHNVDFQFVLKADDDTFARIDTIVTELHSLVQESKYQSLYWGYFSGRSKVFHTGRWAEKSWRNCDHYLPYARGGGYILAKDLVDFIAVNANILRTYNSEDVSVGSWVSALKTKMVHDIRFDTEYESRGCNNNHIVSHKQSVVDIKEKYWTLREAGVLCSKEYQKRPGYEYDWSVLPSKCCVLNKTFY